MEEREIDLLDLWRAIKAKWFIILLITILGLGLGYAVSEFLITDKYQAQTTMIVGKPEGEESGQGSIEYNEVLTNQKLVGTYSEIIKSRSIAELVISNLQLDMEVSDFKEMLEVSSVDNTEVISLLVTDTIPDRARDIANETAEIFQESIQVIMNVDNVQILDPAVSPLEPSEPSPIRNGILLAFLFGFLTIMAICIREVFDNTIKTSEQIEQKYDIPVLGIIPRVKEEVVNVKKA